MEIPADLDSQRYLGPDWAGWLDRLPRRCDDLIAEWSLTPVGAPMHGFASVVQPVRTDAGVDAVLKVGFDGAPETEHEHLALSHWAGNGAVELYRADPRGRAMVLERLHTTDLTSVPDVEACEIVAGFYRRLHRPAMPRLRPLSEFLQRWLDALAVDAHVVPVPRRLLDRALVRGGEFVDDPATSGRIIHGDLHYENVLAADREPWLVIDPQPMSGDPHYEVAPLLWNRWAEMSGRVRVTIGRRFFTVVDAAELDEERARDWVVVRMMLNAHWAVDDAKRMNRPLRADESEWITKCITVAKAVQR